MYSLTNKSKTTQTPTSGFTLIEVLVSLSLFTIVVTISLGTLLVLIDANTKAQNNQIIMTNLSFVLDSMTREIRTGRSYWCATDATTAPSDVSSFATRDCADGAGKVLFVVEGDGSLTGATAMGADRRIGYRVVSYGSSGDLLERKIGSVGNWTPLTLPRNFTLDDMRFTVSGSTRGDTEQPTVTIFMKGTAGDAALGLATTFSIQTTVVQRTLDL